MDETLYIHALWGVTIQSDTTPAKTIYMTGNVRHFEILNGSNLELRNIRLDKTGSGIGGGVSVIGDGGNQSQLYMTEGSVIANTRAINGGAIYASNYGNIFIDGGIIDSTHADENGGGIYLSDSTILVAPGVTIKNATAGENGGGLYSINSTVDFISSAIDSNTASSKGGGMYLESSEGIIDDAFFSGNTAITAGGAIYVTGRAQSNFININGSTFNENRVDGVNGYGGAMCVDNSVNVNLYNLVFNSNSASKGYGGAIAMKFRSVFVNKILRDIEQYRNFRRRHLCI